MALSARPVFLPQLRRRQLAGGAARAEVGSVVFDWERGIPFLPWTIVPYWSIDAFYGLSLLVCTSKAELDNHARRLLTAQIVAVTCFILFPLRFTFERRKRRESPARCSMS